MVFYIRRTGTYRREAGCPYLIDSLECRAVKLHIINTYIEVVLVSTFDVYDIPCNRNTKKLVMQYQCGQVFFLSVASREPEYQVPVRLRSRRYLCGKHRYFCIAGTVVTKHQRRYKYSWTI